MRDMVGRTLGAGIAAVFAATAAMADTSPVVVELFTSQGCSSCPPADALMMDLAKRDGVIALALHVDYWDYIGWRDIFGAPEFTARQHDYARAAHSTTVYTPQFVIGGTDIIVGARAMDIVDRIDAHQGIDTGVTLSASRSGDTITIAADAAAPAPMTVQLVRYAPLETVAIERGENAGRTVDYANIVREWTTLGEWDGRQELTLSVPVTGAMPSVILIQAQGFGAIVAAAAIN